MRSNKELLQLLLDNRTKFEYGLCHLIRELRYSSYISYRESNKLNRYIMRRIRKNGLSEDAFGYYWTCGKWEPREEWLKQQIKILNGKGNIFEILKRWFDRFYHTTRSM